jgi:hypothetical protein
MGKLHVCVVAYKRPVALRSLIDQFILQTDVNWIMTVVHDGPAPEAVKHTISLYANDSRVNFIETDRRQGNWGMQNRKIILSALTVRDDDFILNTNDDNGYVPRFVEFMMRATADINKVGMVYCDFLHHNFDYDIMKTELRVNYVDMGAFIVNVQLAKEVGFRHDDSFPGADGMFAEECAQRCGQLGYRVVYIPKVLFIHN